MEYNAGIRYNVWLAVDGVMYGMIRGEIKKERQASKNTPCVNLHRNFPLLTVFIKIIIVFSFVTSKQIVQALALLSASTINRTRKSLI